MKNYRNSDYALNKFSAGIVYLFTDGTTVTVTLSDYLAENPGKTETDFLTLKNLSDADYFKRDRAENAQTKKNTFFDDLVDPTLCRVPSPEDIFVAEIDAQKADMKRQERLVVADRAMATLTEVQRKRYCLHKMHGKTSREIARMEGIRHQSVVESLAAANEKLKKILTTA